MIKIVKEMEKNLVLIESDCGKNISFGMGEAKQMILPKETIEYVFEVDSEDNHEAQQT